ncbi:MAG: hypothetical protein EXR36_03395 [Betaproteobacteria bacterium]|nr:hypothetical protein [Betaproteobacteria bacterium]
MKLTRSHIIIACMALIIAVLAFALVFYARDEIKPAASHEEKEVATRSAVGNKEGFATVSLSVESQQASGIATADLRGMDSKASAEIFGVVLNPQPLFELRAQYLAALAQSRTQRIALASAQGEHQRLERLYADDRNVSERAVIVARTQWQSEQAKLAAVEQTTNTLRESVRSAWGEKLMSLAVDPRAKTFENLSSQREVLVQISLPYQLRENASKQQMTIGPIGVSDGVRPARYVSPSHHPDTGLSGATFLYLAQGKDLRVGMRVAGRLETGGGERSGVLVLQAAVVWHGGKAWCYVQEESDKFVRKEVNTTEELGGGWFNAEGFEAGEKVVVRGAQLLLSEEQKFQIREENDD